MAERAPSNRRPQLSVHRRGCGPRPAYRRTTPSAACAIPREVLRSNSPLAHHHKIWFALNWSPITTLGALRIDLPHDFLPFRLLRFGLTERLNPCHVPIRQSSADDQSRSCERADQLLKSRLILR